MAKKATFICALLIAYSIVNAQSVSIDDSTLFDFWVGEWNLTWTNADGKIESGYNRIEKILDGKVIQEHFSDDKNSFKGTSISVYNAQKKTWHQAWADNQGGYFDFEGSVSDGNRMFSTGPTEINGVKIIRRMVFHDIKQNTFIWDWEVSKDGGKSWELRWRINYKRKEKA